MPRRKNKGNKSGGSSSGGGGSPTPSRPDPPGNAPPFPEQMSPSDLNDYLSTSERDGTYEYFSSMVRQYLMEDNLIKPFVVLLTLLTLAMYSYYITTELKHDLEDPLEAMIEVFLYAYTPAINWAAFLFDIHPADALHGEIKNPSGYFIGLPLLFYLLWRIRAIAVHRASTHPAGINCASSCLEAHIFLQSKLLFAVAVSAALPKIIQFITYVAPSIPSSDPSWPTHPFWLSLMDAETFELVTSCCWLFFNLFTAGAVLYSRFAVYSHRREVGVDFAVKVSLSEEYWLQLLRSSFSAEMFLYWVLIFVVRINLFTLAWTAFYPDIAKFFEFL